MNVQLREPVSPTVRIGFVGDLRPGSPEYRPIRKDPRLREILHACDFVVANLEGPLTDVPCCKDFGFPVHSAPAGVRELADLNVQVADLANNHIMDCGEPGLEETLRILDAHGISRLGAGRDESAASAPLVRTVAAGTLAFLAYGVRAPDAPSVATADTPGAAMLDLDAAKGQIAALREAGHIVCVLFHGGWEHFRIPCRDYVTALREMAAAGAQLVIGHHAHAFQGIEARDGGLIAYSLGNFCFSTCYQSIHRGWRLGLLLTVEIDQRGPCAYAAHFVHHDWREPALRLVRGEGEGALRQLLAEVSDALLDERRHAREWRRDCARMLLGLNTVGGWWPVRVLCRALWVVKHLLTARRRGNRPALASRLPLYMCSPKRVLVDALLGIPAALLHFRNTTRCYRAYDLASRSDGAQGTPLSGERMQ